MIDQLAFLIPSFIDSEQRLSFSKKSFESLCSSISNAHFFVLDDIPRYKNLLAMIPKFKYINSVYDVYKGENLSIRRRVGKGNLTAVKVLLKTLPAKYKYVFLHLDDCIYLPIFKQLIDWSLQALESENELNMVKLSDYPIMHSSINENLGNTTNIKVSSQEVKFDKNILQKQDFGEFALWKNRIEEAVPTQNYWPLTLWMNVFRREFLERALTIPELADTLFLGPAEKVYFDNWKNLKKHLPGELGFINMQFGGFEMHRNDNWEKLISYPNKPVR